MAAVKLNASFLPTGTGNDHPFCIYDCIGYADNLIKAIHQRLQTGEIDKFGVFDGLIGHWQVWNLTVK